MKKLYLPCVVPIHGILKKHTLIRLKKNLTGWMKIKHVFFDEQTREYFIQPTTGKSPYCRFNKFPSENFITDRNCPYKMGLTKEIKFNYESI
tara:strand:+ start:330 stop:605 length:276 start_codon:yes stop_codon:yes gene_type:complete